MIPIFIPVDKETYDAMSIDISDIDGMFPKWYWYWLGIVALSFVALIYGGMIFNTETLDIRIYVPDISYFINDFHIWIHFKRAIQYFDFFFFYIIYSVFHMMYIVVEPKKLITEILTFSAILFFSISTWLSVIYIM